MIRLLRSRARDDLVNLVTRTAALVAPEGWSDLGKPSWGSCSAGGGDGVRASWFYTREPLPEHASNAESVADYWTSLGMSVRVVSEPAVSVYAEGGGAASIAFHTEPGLQHLRHIGVRSRNARGGDRARVWSRLTGDADRSVIALSSQPVWSVSARGSSQRCSSAGPNSCNLPDAGAPACERSVSAGVRADGNARHDKAPAGSPAGASSCGAQAARRRRRTR